MIVGVSAGLGATPAAATTTPSCSSAGITLTPLHGPVFYIDPGASPALTSAYAGYHVTNGTGSALSDVWVQLSSFTGGSVALGSGQPAAEQIATLGNGSGDAVFWYLSASGQSATAQNHTITVYSHRPDLAGSTALCTASGGFTSVLSTIAASANKITAVNISATTPQLGGTFSISVDGNTGNIGAGTASDPGAFWMSPSAISGWPAGAYRLIGTSLLISPDGTAAQQTYPDTLHLTNLGSTARPYTATYTFQAVGYTPTAATLQPAQQIASGTQIKHTGSYPTTVPAIPPATNDIAVGLTGSPSRLPTGGGTVSYVGSLTGTVGTSVDAFNVVLPSGATIVPGSAAYNGTPLPDPASSGSALVFAGPFTLTSPSNPLTFQVSFDGTVGTRTVSLSSSVGSVVIDTTPNNLTDNVPATASVVVNAAPVAHDDSVNVAQNSAGASVNVLANDTDPDGDSVSVTGVGTAAHGTATLSSGVIHYTPTSGYVGSDSFTYSIGDGNGGTATATVHVTVAVLTAQTITFAQPSDVTITDSGVSVTASASSGLPVSYGSSTPSVCSVNASTGAVALLAAGTCTISADQSGNSTYAAAPTVTRSFSVNKAGQSITFTQPSDATANDSTFVVSASSSSGLPIAYSSSTTDVCTVDAVTGAVTFLGAGTCTITADQPGDDVYTAATAVTRSFSVTKAAQTISFAAAPDVALTQAGVEVTATSDSGLPITYASLTGEVCAVDPETGAVTLYTTGTCTISAAQPGDALHAAAPTRTASFEVTVLPPPRDPQTITFEQPADVTLLDNGVGVSATSDAGLPITYSSDTTSVCTVDPDTGAVALVSAGTCTIAADQAGDLAYLPAETITRSFQVSKVAQAISFAQPADVTIAETGSAVNATSDAGLPVSYSSATPATCAIDTATGAITPYAPGTCTVEADQGGDDTYLAAATVDRSFAVTLVPQEITFDQPADVTLPLDVTMIASSSSGLPVSFTSLTPSVCLVDEFGIVTFLAQGSCTINAAQDGDATYGPATAVQRTFTAAPEPQIITADTPPDVRVGDGPVTITADASSGLTPAFASNTPDVCAVDESGQVTLLQPGVCSITVSQAGDGYYASASTAVQFTVLPALVTQQIDFPALADVPVTYAAAWATASSSSELPIAYATETPDTCSVDVTGMIELLAVGTCTVRAEQAGDETYAAADPVSRSFSITTAPQTITFDQPSDTVVTDTSYAVAAVSSSGLPVTYESTTPDVCTVDADNGAVTIVAAGTCTVTARQAGDGTYAAADDVTRSFTVNRLAQTITATVPGTADLNTGSVDIIATASSGLPVVVTAGPSDICTAESVTGGGVITLLATGDCTVTVSAPGDAVYADADPVSDVLVIGAATGDDHYQVSPAAPGHAGTVLDVLANDDSGMVLVSVSQPAHGQATIVGNSIVFTPSVGYKGTETFTYVTRDQGNGLHTASVTVTVPDTAPTITGASATTVAGQPVSVHLKAADINGDQVALTAAPVGGARLTVSGHTLSIRPGLASSGVLTVTVRADDGDGGWASATVRVRVNPVPVTRAIRRLAVSGTHVSWTPAPTSRARYEVRVNGVVRCITAVTSCQLRTHLGPAARVRVTVLGQSRTRSRAVTATPRSGAAIRVGTVYFGSGSAWLSPTERAKALAVERRLFAAGFRTMRVIGFTDSLGPAADNLRLGHQRAVAVRAALQRHPSVQVLASWRGEAAPAASNATEAGRALNRRVEIWVR